MKSAKLKQKRNARDDAYDQLKSTLELFTAKKVDFGKRKIEACMCVGLKSPMPKISAQSQAKNVEMWNLFNAELIVSNVWRE
jgi:hypothetical protein